MAKTLKEMPITTANARSKLGPGEYARRLDADAAVWYRKGKRGGVWFARWRNWGPGANYRQAPVGPANDLNDKPTDGVLTFLQAEARARQIVDQARREAKAEAAGPVLTVRLVVESYIADRD
ncbi:MAG: integrase, partial [Mesorhizobium sp.]